VKYNAKSVKHIPQLVSEVNIETVSDKGEGSVHNKVMVAMMIT